MGAGLWPWHQVRTQLPQPETTPSPSRQPGDHPEESMAAMVSHVDASQAVALFPAETCPLLCQGEWRSPLPPAPFPICDLGPLPSCSLFGFLQVAWSTSLGSISSFRVNRACTLGVCHVPANLAPLELRCTTRLPGGLGWSGCQAPQVTSVGPSLQGRGWCWPVAVRCL